MILTRRRALAKAYYQGLRYDLPFSSGDAHGNQTTDRYSMTSILTWITITTMKTFYKSTTFI